MTAKPRIASRLRLLCSALAILLLAPAAARAGSAADPFVRRVEAHPDGALLVAVESGTVEVVRGEGAEGELRIEAEVHGFGAGDVEFSLVRRGDDWILRAREAEWLRWVSQGPRVLIRASVPPDFPVRFARAGESGPSRAEKVALRLAPDAPREPR